MFESTIAILSETPFALIALLPVVLLTAKFLWKHWKPLGYLAGFFAIIGLLPVFVLFVAGEFTNSDLLRSFGSGLFDIELSIAVGLVRLYDAVVAAWLRLVVIVAESLLSTGILQPETWTNLLETFIPSVAGLGLGLTILALHFTGGVLLVYGIYRGQRLTPMNILMHIGGGALLLAGIFVGLMGQVGVGDPAFSVLLVSVIGVQAGVTTVLIALKPDFSEMERSEGIESLNRFLQELRGTARDRLKRIRQNEPELRSNEES